MIDGNPPYMNETPMKAMYLISRKGKPEIKSKDEISISFDRFLDRCLTVEPSKRAAAKDLLNDRFVKDNAGATVDLVPNIRATRQKKQGLLWKEKLINVISCH